MGFSLGARVGSRQKILVVNQSIKKTVSESVLTSQKRTIYTAGRPPWYNTAGQQVEPFVIGIHFPIESSNLNFPDQITNFGTLSQAYVVVVRLVKLL